MLTVPRHLQQSCSARPNVPDEDMRSMSCYNTQSLPVTHSIATVWRMSRYLQQRDRF